MSHKSSWYVLMRLTLLLAILNEARPLPALESMPLTTTLNTLEETDKLPETNLDFGAVQDAGLVVENNGTTPVKATSTDVQNQGGVS